MTKLQLLTAAAAIALAPTFALAGSATKKADEDSMAKDEMAMPSMEECKEMMAGHDHDEDHMGSQKKEETGSAAKQEMSEEDMMMKTCEKMMHADESYAGSAKK